MNETIFLTMVYDNAKLAESLDTQMRDKQNDFRPLCSFPQDVVFSTKINAL